MNLCISIISIILLLGCCSTIALGQSTIKLEPLIITEDKSDGLLKPNHYSKEMLQSIAGSANDPFRALQALPAIAFSNDFDARLFIRGGAPEDVKTTLDGFTAGYPYHFLGLSSTIPIALLEGITIYPGGFPIELGNYLGGIVEVHTAKPKQTRGSFSLQMNQVAIFYETLFKNKGFVQLSLRKEFYELILADWNEAEQLPSNHDFFAKATWANWTVLIAGAQDKATLFTTSPTSDQKKPTSIFRASNLIGLEHQLSKNRLAIQTKLSFLTEPQTYTIDAANHFEQQPLTISLESTATVELPNQLLKCRLNGIYKKPTVHIKISDYFDAAAKYLTPGQELFSSTTIEWNNRSLSLSDLIILSPELSCYMGIGWDYSSILDQHYLSPRIQMAYTFNEHNKVTASFGNFYQEPEPIVLAQTNQNNFTYNQALHYILQYNARITNQTELILSGYYKDLFRLEAIASDGTVHFNGKGIAKGVELGLSHKWKKTGYFSVINYTLSSSIRYLEKSCNWVDFDNDRTHQLSVLHHMNIFSFMDASLKWSYNTGQPYTDSGDTVNNRRLPDYHRLDLKFKKSFKLDEVRIQVFLDFINVYNQINYSRLVFSNLYASQNYYIQFPALVMAGIEVGF